MKDQKLLSLIEIAIQKEEEAFVFYMDLHGRVSDPIAKEALKFVADEEKKHKEFLVKYREGEYGAACLSPEQTVNYKIAEHLEAPDIQKNMESKDVYLVAAHRELASCKFYWDLAGAQPEGEAKYVLIKMAQEEMRHKEKMEYLYSNTAFPQTAGG